VVGEAFPFINGITAVHRLVSVLLEPCGISFNAEWLQAEPQSVVPVCVSGPSSGQTSGHPMRFGRYGLRYQDLNIDDPVSLLRPYPRRVDGEGASVTPTRTKAFKRI
jgi:hypothetical protein